MKKLLLILVLLSVFLVSCSKDDDQITNKVTSATMTINGVPETFQFTGRGITLTQNGKYDLQLWLNSLDNQNRSIIIELYLGEKGKNKIDRLYFYENGVDYDNMVDATFTDQVFVNNRKQFNATFSGTIQNGINTISITNAKINYVYEESF